MTAETSELIGLRRAEREYGVSRKLLERLVAAGELESVPGPRRARLVKRVDVEDLVARTGRCQGEGCDKALPPGQALCPSCHAKAINAEIWTTERREAARKRGRKRFPKHSQKGIDNIKRAREDGSAASHAQLAVRKEKGDLVDALDIAIAKKVTAKHVYHVARKLELPGVSLTWWNGKTRRLWNKDEASAIMAAIHRARKLDGNCVDCGEPVYNRLRCDQCAPAARKSHLSELQSSASDGVDELAAADEKGLAATAKEVGRAKSKVAARAKDLELGRAVVDALGRRNLLFSHRDRQKLKTSFRNRPPAWAKTEVEYARYRRAKLDDRAAIGRVADDIAQENGKRSGRPGSFDNPDGSAMRDRIHELHALPTALRPSPRKIAATIRQEFERPISEPTVRRELGLLGR